MIEVNNHHHGFVIAKAAGCQFNPVADAVISRSDRERLRGGVIYQGYTGSSIEAHIAGWGAGWMTKDFLWVIFDYPFTQLECKLIFLQIPTRNSKSLAFARKLGFKEVVIIEEVFPDCDLCVMALRRDDCRFLDISCEARRLMTVERATGGQEE